MSSASSITAARRGTAILNFVSSSNGLGKHSTFGSTTNPIKQLGKSPPSAIVTFASVGQGISVTFRILGATAASLTQDQLDDLKCEFLSAYPGVNPGNVTMTLADGSIVVSMTYNPTTPLSGLSSGEASAISNLPSSFADTTSILNNFNRAVSTAGLSNVITVPVNATVDPNINVSIGNTIRNSVNTQLENDKIDGASAFFGFDDTIYVTNSTSIFIADPVSGTTSLLLNIPPEIPGYLLRGLSIIGVSRNNRYLTIRESLAFVPQPYLGNYKLNYVYRVDTLNKTFAKVAFYPTNIDLVNNIFYNPFADTLYYYPNNSGVQPVPYRFTGLSTFTVGTTTEIFPATVLSRMVYLSPTMVAYVDGNSIKKCNLFNGAVSDVIGTKVQGWPQGKGRYDFNSNPPVFSTVSDFGVNSYSVFQDKLTFVDKGAMCVIVVKNVLGTASIERIIGVPNTNFDANGYVDRGYVNTSGVNFGRISAGINWTSLATSYITHSANTLYVMNFDKFKWDILNAGPPATLDTVKEYYKLFQYSKIDGDVVSLFNFYNTIPKVDDMVYVVSPNNIEAICVQHKLRANGTGPMIISAIFNNRQVTTIGVNAFNGCAGFKETLTLPQTITSIQENAFQGCINLVGPLSIPSSLVTIKSNAFNGCNRLKGTLNFPNTLKSIGDIAFNGCYSLTGPLLIPDSVTTLDRSVFRGCSGLDGRLHIPNTLTIIYEGTFHDCSKLNGQLIIPSTVKTIGFQAFFNCYGFTGELVIPDSVTSIANNTFLNCRGFQSLRLSKNLRTINTSAFQNCSGLTGNLSIPEGVAAISSSAFNGCNGLTSLTLPSTIRTIDANAFTNCSNLRGTLYIPLIVNVASNAFVGTPLLTIIRGNPPAEPNMEYVGDIILVLSADGSYYIVIGHRNGKTASGTINIPSRSNGKPIRVIRDFAFKDYTQITQLVIPDCVEVIGISAFENCTSLANNPLIIPNSVTSIGEAAFKSCESITRVILPNNLTHISNSVFSKCYAFIGDLVIPNSVTSIGDYAFYASYNLSGSLLTIPNSVTSIGINAFGECRGFSGPLVIPNSVTSIGEGAFYDCRGFTGTLTLSNNLTEILKDTFWNCEKLVGSLVIPNSVTRIDSEAFNNCDSLTGNFTLPTNLRTIGAQAFRFCRSLTGSITIPNNVTEIGESAFIECEGITGSITIPDTLRKIEYGVFSGCNNATTINIAENISSIGDVAYSDCSNLSGIVNIKSNVVIGSKAFRNTGSLVILTSPNTDVYVNNVILSLSSNGLSYNVKGHVLGEKAIADSLVIPSSYNGLPVLSISPRAFDGCSGIRGSLVIPNTISSIGKYAFRGCSGFTGPLVIPDSVTSIENYAFSGCAALSGTLTLSTTLTSINYATFQGCNTITQVLIPPSVTSIADYAFDGCGALATVTFVANLLSIGNNSFSRCGLTSLTIPGTVTSIGSAAFQLCRNIAGSVIMPDGVVVINDSIFEGCVALQSVDSANGTTRIGRRAFFGCNNLTNSSSKLITPSITSIGDSAFSGCSKFNTTLVFPASVTSIGANAFSDCVLLQGPLTIPNTVTSVGDNAFRNCTGITGLLTLSTNLTSIGNGVFQNCAGLTGTLTIPNGVTRIGYRAFLGCRGLTGTLTISSNVTNIGGFAFQDCSNLTTLVIQGTPRIDIEAFKGCTIITGSYTVGSNYVDIYAFKDCPSFTRL
jgi:hypothetical protein